MTFIFDKSGDAVACVDCYNKGTVEFYGYCASCWSELKPEQRAILEGKEPPIKEIVRTTTIKAPSFLVKLWRVGVTAVVLYLYWKTR